MNARASSHLHWWCCIYHKFKLNGDGIWPQWPAHRLLMRDNRELKVHINHANIKTYMIDTNNKSTEKMIHLILLWFTASLYTEHYSILYDTIHSQWRKPFGIACKLKQMLHFSVRSLSLYLDVFVCARVCCLSCMAKKNLCVSLCLLHLQLSRWSEWLWIQVK